MVAQIAGRGVEIERKYLVVAEHPTPDVPFALLRQGYLVTNDAGQEVRLRAADDARFWLTYKQGVGAIRVEHESELTASQFADLWPATEGRRLEKRRYRVQLGSLHAEVDVYLGALDGLRTVEVEFPDTDLLQRFTPPEWFGREITEDLSYKLRTLVVRGLPAEHGTAP